MASKVEIANMALQRIGSRRITSFSDGTEESIACNLIYDTVVDYVISQGAWTSATARSSLAQTANTPSYGYTYEYQLPVSPKCLRVIEINETPSNAVNFRIEGDKLLSDSSTMKIKYIQSISDPTKFSPHLTEAIISRMALELSYRFAAKVSLSNRIEVAYQRALEEGLAIDGMQGTDDILYSNDLIEDR